VYFYLPTWHTSLSSSGVDITTIVPSSPMQLVNMCTNILAASISLNNFKQKCKKLLGLLLFLHDHVAQFFFSCRVPHLFAHVFLDFILFLSSHFFLHTGFFQRPLCHALYIFTHTRFLQRLLCGTLQFFMSLGIL
jgi:hypothetical protein